MCCSLRVILPESHEYPDSHHGEIAMTRRLMPTALASLALAPTASAQDCSLLDLHVCAFF